ncbi:MAG: hypothetical protein DRI69_03270 [Bacteroidetes bacterium]|nr:MAG: hypothetical protein DRI69_03270 [Bacteroidota bacterium]
MSAQEIIKEIQQLPVSQRMLVIEQTLKSIRASTHRQNMENAVEEVIEDYTSDKELSSFTDIDFDRFYETK